jgi:hypothetical protein
MRTVFGRGYGSAIRKFDDANDNDDVFIKNSKIFPFEIFVKPNP